ncbi:P-II family nitrogen regulator [Kocuria sp. TGY1127_2]|uniref:P-II family nitrogen regulator n=1 Tax=Kocuria sp. TGY1127_2 TaxID=2711328 RepID=UPI0015BF4B8F|nr:P-II family nitrogen regulator [Kocuria sp. TGY1127_2]
MKLVTAIVRPEQYESVKEALEAFGIHGMTVSETAGYGRQKGHTEVYRGAEYAVDLLLKVRLEILATEQQAIDVVEVIVSSANTGTTGDGKVWIQPIEEIVRVRTGERGEQAI